MAWTYENSMNRVEGRWARRSELDISVEKLGRLMDLENITLPKSKRVYGVHIYATVAGSGQIDGLADTGRPPRASESWARGSRRPRASRPRSRSR